jgi:hypothetical protein
MLRPEELRAVQATFGAADPQVRRDHLLSHVIAAVAHADGEWVLYGGTGLARTHLPSFRLSEDLDLLAHPRRVAVAELEGVVARQLRREFGAVQWQPPLSWPRRTRRSCCEPTKDWPSASRWVSWTPTVGDGPSRCGT